MTDQDLRRRSSADRWPVVHEQPLLRAERRLWRRFRNPDTLPLLPLGCVYVFRSGDRFTRVDGAEVCGSDPSIVDAQSVSVVANRCRRMWVWTRVPTTDIAVDLLVGVSFECTVTDPAVVARDALMDLYSELCNRVRFLPALAAHRHKYSPDEVLGAQTAIRHDLEKIFRGGPPQVEGMRIRFDGATVDLPGEFLHHQRELRNSRWAHEQLSLRLTLERERVEHTQRELLCSAERSEATAVTRKERSADQAASRQFQERDAQTERLIAQVKDWLDGDGAKRAPVDRRQIVEALFSKLVGSPGYDVPNLPTTGIVELPAPELNGRARADITTHVAPDDPDGG